MMRKKCCLLFCLVSLITTFVGAQRHDYLFSRIDVTNGLSHNQTNCIYKDAKGFMWFGTLSGLNRFDGYNFKVYRHNVHDSLSIDDDYILKIGEGPDSTMLVQTRNGLNIYDPQTDKFVNTNSFLRKKKLPDYINNFVKAGDDFYFVSLSDGLCRLDKNNRVTFIKHVDLNPSSIDAATISDLKKDARNNLVLMHENGVLERFNGKEGKVIFRSSITPQLTKENVTYSVFVDADDDMWLYAPSRNFGVVYYNSKTNTYRRVNKELGILNNNIVNAIIEDDKGMLWIGTDHGGINVLDKKTMRVNIISSKEDDVKTLSENCIYTLYKDNTGIIWTGTFKKGVSYYADDLVKFPVYRRKSSEAPGLQFDDVNRFAEDAKGNLWIGTNGGGLICFNRKENTFTQYKHDAKDANSITNDVIVSLCFDHTGKLWIGTYYGGLDCFDGNKFIHYKHSSNPSSIADDKVWEIYEDANDNLWVGTLGAGVDLFDRKKNVFYHHNTRSVTNALQSDYISAFEVDRDSNLWIGTAYGIDVRDAKTGAITHYNTAGSGLSNYNVNAILKDRNNNIWVGTREGLNVFDYKTKKFQSFRIEDGLPDNTIWTIVEDNKGYLWVSTSSGLSKIEAKSNNGQFAISCKNYDETDGLQGRVFNDNAGFKTSKGELVFGGANGFNIVNPAQIKTNNSVPVLVFTDLQVFNESIKAGDKLNNRIVLDNAVTYTNNIKLRYNENVFSIEFAALNTVNTLKIKYAYNLEGFNKQWLTTDSKNRRATFTNLDPGDYTFHVKASNEDGIWNDEGIQLHITILPPFWRTPLAYLLYVLVALAILYFARRMVIQRAHMRFALAQERKEAQRLHELDMMKIKFFTNVSHEFRTPLSLILTPLDKMIRHAKDAEERKQFQLIHRNGRRLLNLVNQLLDFRKIEVQELRLNAAPGDVIKFVKNISYSFTDIAEKKNIGFAYTSQEQQLFTSFDHDKLERILFNLLSNAFKFTPENGKVNVEVIVDRNGNKALLTIKVIDTGIGIPPEKQERIFERFFQNEIPGTLVNKGSGIGLSITKEFVKMHNGSVHVESEIDKGSCFIVKLPFEVAEELPTIKPLDDDLTEFAIEAEQPEEELVIPAPEVVKHTGKKPTILLVEDNEDFRFYLKDNLREFFNIVEAPNGKIGWQKALAEHPQLIVSDISMPVMDGIDLCKKIKTDARTRQIPVILLTAITAEEQMLRGLQTGATDYMTKPFNFEVMLSRIRNILAQQETMKKTLTKQVQAKISDVPVESAEEKFIQQALQIVEKNISNPDFSVEELSRELCMSRVAVYKRIFAITAKSPIEFIRSIRLERAAQLLEKTQMTVAEVAYEVGFNNPKYFTKYFKAAYNVVPSVYVAEKRKEVSTQ